MPRYVCNTQGWWYGLERTFVFRLYEISSSPRVDMTVARTVMWYDVSVEYRIAINAFPTPKKVTCCGLSGVV